MTLLSSQHMRHGRWAVVALLLAYLSGCGFQLQGRVPLSPVVAVVFIDTADTQSDFVQALRRGLRQGGARLALSASEPGATVLRVERDEFVERVASISSRNIPREFEVTYLVRFSFDRDGVRRIESEELAASRDFSFDERAALAKLREREGLREQLAADLAGRVLQRLASLR